MNKEQWQDLYNTLAEALTRFNANYYASDKGKNKQIREKAGREVDYAISTATSYIERNWEAYELLTGGVNAHDYTRAINYDEFKQPRYFSGDMGEYLKKIQYKIQSFE